MSGGKFNCTLGQYHLYLHLFSCIDDTVRACGMYHLLLADFDSNPPLKWGDKWLTVMHTRISKQIPSSHMYLDTGIGVLHYSVTLPQKCANEIVIRPPCYDEVA